MTDNDSAVGNVFDALSRLTQTTQTYGSSGVNPAYTYDIMKRRASMADSVGSTTYSYDELNRLTGLTDPAGRPFSFAFDTASRPISMAMPNGINASMSYDVADQLLSFAYGNGGTTVASAGYQYNLTGTRSSEAREDGNTHTFGYDGVDRVLSSVNNLLAGKDEGFGYDREGNSATRAQAGQTNSLVFDAMDELTSDSTYDYSYDAEGNLVRKLNRSNSADVTNYSYDAQDRLVEVQTPAATVIYAYDAMGRRVARAINGTTTRYILDGQNVRLELNGSNALVGANTHAGLDNLLVRDQGGVPIFFQRDALGSTTALTNASGAVVERYRYSAFGKLEVLNPDFTAKIGNLPTQSYTYTGREWEPEAGLYFSRARFFEPVLGRFVSRDPTKERGGLNLYGYVGNNAINAIDPFGLAPNMGGVTSPYHVLNQFNNGATLQQLSASHLTNDSRYFYTDKFGWVDIRHFGEAASRVQSGQPGLWVETLGFGNEIGQWLTEWGDAYRSGFSPEDLSSNSAGVDFGRSILPGESLADAFSRWGSQNGAKSPLDPAAKFWDLPLTDPSVRPKHRG